MKRFAELFSISLLALVVTTRPAFGAVDLATDTPLPAKTVNGVQNVSWAGTFAELLAADALAMCWTTQQERYAGPGYQSADSYLVYLQSLMSASTCTSTCTTNVTLDGQSVCPTVDRWLIGRQDKTCNINPDTGAAQALKVKLRATSQTSAYVPPTVATLALAGTGATQARYLARDELGYAELSLCMAQQLREKLDSAEVAFSSPDNVVALQTMIRERALTAVYKYATLAKIFASTVTPPTTLNDPKSFPAVLSVMGRGTAHSSLYWDMIGEDFGSAIQLLSESTTAVVEAKLFSATAQRNFGTPPGFYSLEFSGPRVDMLDILYGPGAAHWYALGTPAFILPPLRLSKTQAVVTDTSDPQIAVLLGFARRANALKLGVAWPGSSSSIFYAATSADTLYRAVENMLRADDCARGISSVCTPIGSSGETSNLTTTILATRYRITKKDHVLPLVRALAEGAFGLPDAPSRDKDIWTYGGIEGGGAVSSKMSPNYAFTTEQRPFHLLGAHSYVPAVGSPPTTLRPDQSVNGNVVIDPNFTVRPLKAPDRQSARPAVRLIALDITPLGDGPSQIGDFAHDFVQTTPAYLRGIGSVTALAVARESLLQLSALGTTLRPRAIYNKTKEALALVERTIGTRQALVRQTMTSVSDPSACGGCIYFKGGYNPTNDTYPVTLNVVTKTTDAATDVAITASMPSAMTAVLSSSYVSPGLVRGSALPALSFAASTATAFGTDVFRRASGSWSGAYPNIGVSTFLRSGTPASYRYEHVYTGIVGDKQNTTVASNGAYGAVVAFGGTLNRMAEEAWEFNNDVWTQPAFDAFGLPRDWAPTADASLAGDQAGVTDQQHFLARASDAAQQASQALQEAQDLLEQQTTDDLLIASSDEKAKEVSTLELQSVCGRKVTCSSNLVSRSIPVPTCNTSINAQFRCIEMNQAISKIVGLSLRIENPVDIELGVGGSSAPTFGDYEGGAIQGLLLAQWNAWHALQDAISTATYAVGAAEESVVTAAAEVTAADADWTQAKADVASAYNALLSQVAGLNAQLVQYQSSVAQYENQMATAKLQIAKECSYSAALIAEQSGWSYSGDDRDDLDTYSYSPASVNAQTDKCNQAGIAWHDAFFATKAQRESVADLLKYLQQQADYAGLAWQGLDTHVAAAVERTNVAKQRELQAHVASDATMATGLEAVQAAFGQVLATQPPIARAFAGSDEAIARQQIEQQHATYDIRARFGVRKRFHSYDLWRARALNDNARRLAVAARRAIESRYVVDLTELTAPEPFVDAPALWADEVYSSDLRPSTIGRTAAPQESGGVYTSKLVDYVENLRLFLDGYAVQRPSAVVRSDTEILQFGGPAHIVTTSAGEGNITYLDADSAGWSFYCPGALMAGGTFSAGTWVRNPGSAGFSTGTLASSLSTLCPDTNGDGLNEPPTRARLPFSLDPWGRINASATNPPVNARYNVRLGTVAINLVGTGIHDCERAGDPDNCYASPFVRYDLRQVGPVWVSSFEQTWRSLNVPPAVAEDGKALAIEEWLDPVSNGFNRSDVQNVSRAEFAERPIGGAYELYLNLPPEVRVERIERIQLLVQTHYWVRQQ